MKQHEPNIPLEPPPPILNKVWWMTQPETCVLYNSGITADVHGCHCTSRPSRCGGSYIYIFFFSSSLRRFQFKKSWKRKKNSILLFQVWARWSIIRETQTGEVKGQERERARNKAQGKGLTATCWCTFFGTNTTTSPRALFFFLSSVRITPENIRHEENSMWMALKSRTGRIAQPQDDRPI